MGAVWLWDLPNVLSAAGLNVATYPGWEARARSTGGYDKLLAVQVHHTASNTSPGNDMSYIWDGSPDRPIGAIYLARDGRLTVGAAGATNTSGKGGPLATSGGTIPLDAANRYVVSIEAANNGVGETWSATQLDAYRRAVAAIVHAYALVPAEDIHAHFEWTSRKIDPAGPSPYASGSASWNMDEFRNDVIRLVPNPPGFPPSTPLPGVNDMLYPINPYRNSDTRVFGGPIPARTTRRFALSSAVFPANVSAVAMNVTVVDADRPGFVTVWVPGQPLPDASCVNMNGDRHVENGSVVVGVDGLEGFNIHATATCHLVVDVTGYWTT